MPRRVIRELWKIWEGLFHVAGRVRPIRPGEPYLFLIAKRRYIGRSFTVDGVNVKCFDRIIELHIDNALVLRLLTEDLTLVGLAMRLLHEARRSLPILAEAVSDGRFRKEQVLLGVTFVHRGVERLGFHTLPIRGPIFSKLSTWYLFQVFRVVNKSAEKLMRAHPQTFIPKMVAMSKAKLCADYGNQLEKPIYDTQGEPKSTGE